MRTWPRGGLLAFGLLAMLSGCTDSPLVKVVVSYAGFAPGCVEVVASDPNAGSASSARPPVPPGSRQGQLTVMVWGQSGWGNQLLVTAEAHELSCSGPVVADDRSAVTVKAGQTTLLPLALNATDADQDGFVSGPRGSDCDDAIAGVHPGAQEVCNGRDDNCAGGTDEGFAVNATCGDAGCGTVQCAADGGTFCAPGQAFYPDGDSDGYGRTPEVVFSCTAPGGYVRDAGDCDDTLAAVHPGAVEVCNGRDDNCAGGIDEGFALGAGCATEFGCPGQNTCAADGGVVCQVTGGGSGMHPDLDEDGHGAPAEVCITDAGIPLVTSADDCDDGDPFTAAGFPEICDRRDNDCDGQVDKNDAGVPACPADAGWIAHQAGGTGHHWKSIWSWTDGGVWATGQGQRLRVHAPGDSYSAGTQWAKNWDSDCPNGDYSGMWADPATGEGFAVSGSASGIYCAHDMASGTTSDQSAMATKLPDPWALVGFRIGPALQLFVAGHDGGTLAWFGDGGAQALDPIDGARLNDIHGTSPLNLWVAAQAPGTPAADPQIWRFSPPSSWTQTPLPAPLQNNGTSVEAIYAVSPRLAYAVTDGGAVLEWDGGSWGLHSSPPNAGPLRGVLAFGRDSLFVIDAQTAWEWNGATWTKLLDGGTAAPGLVDIHGTNPADIWVAQDPQMVYRWPQ